MAKNIYGEANYELAANDPKILVNDAMRLAYQQGRNMEQAANILLL